MSTAELTPRELAEIELLHLLDEEAVARARVSLIAFAQYINPRYRPAWHHRKLAAALEACERGECTSLVVSMPPRHGKSELVSRLFPAWALGRNPHNQIIASSYSSDLATKNSRDVQRIIDSDAYRRVFPGTRLNESNVRTTAGGSIRTAEMFEVVSHRGYLRSAGVGGGITGLGANIAIVDDPVKNRQDAMSATMSQNNWEWNTSTLLTRMEDPGVVILVMTRWATDDLVGRALELASADPQARQWKVINFPAIRDDEADPEDPRKLGEALWSKYPLPVLEQIRATIGEADWASLYQQRPSPAGGGLYAERHLRYWHRGVSPGAITARLVDGTIVPSVQAELPLSFDRIIQSWDLTFGKSATSDFVAGVVLGKKGADAWLLDFFLKRADFLETLAAIKAMSAKWSEAREILIEKKANGDAAMTVLRKDLPGIIGVEPEGGKVSRANAVAPYFEAGNVYLPHPALHPQVKEVVAQLIAFPNAAHDDAVDALSQGLSRLYAKRKAGLYVFNSE